MHHLRLILALIITLYTFSGQTNVRLCKEVFNDSTNDKQLYNTINPKALFELVKKDPNCCSTPFNFENHFSIGLSPYQRALVHALGPRKPLTEAREVWGKTKFSDPRQHSNKFKYLVHGLMNPLDFLVDNKFQDISKWNLFSVSLITETKQSTWSGVGLILEVPSENIFASAPADFGSNPKRLRSTSETQRLLSFYSTTIGLDSPDSLIQRTAPHSYNEILVSGATSENKTIKVIGVFVNIETLTHESVMQHLEPFFFAARNLDLPIITIPP